MPVITPEMEAMIAATAMCYVATVNADGTPNLSPKASLSVIDGQTLGFCNMASPQTVANLRDNPAIEVNVVDIFSRKGYRFKGTATLLQDGPEFDLVANRLLERAGADYVVLDVVRIAVDAAKEVVSPVYTVYPDSREEDVRRHYRDFYARQAG